MALASALACTAPANLPRSGDTATPPPAEPPDNVLLVVLDDIGLDRLGLYGLSPDPVPTPRLDALAAESLLFDNAWANPTCTPTRASLLTGRHGRRTGAGVLVSMAGDEWALPDETWTLPEALQIAPDTWSTAAIGKWHLAGEKAPDFLDHPLRAGFGRVRGSPGYLVNNQHTGADSYFHWEKNTDGDIAFSDVYNTTDTVDEALRAASELPEPWMLLVAFNAAHVPLHVPPADLHDRGVDDDSADPDLHDAMVQAMDTELGRLLDGLPMDRVSVYLTGDNGTPDFVIDPEVLDPTHDKGTIHEGGIRVPFLMRTAGMATAGRVSSAPVHVTDLFPTIAEAAGLLLLTDPDGHQILSPTGPVRLDGRSLTPLLSDPSASLARDFVYTERFLPNGPPPWDDWAGAVRDQEWKLEVRGDGSEDFHRLGPGLDEGADLLDGEPLSGDADAAYDRLRAAMDALDAALVYEGR